MNARWQRRSDDMARHSRKLTRAQKMFLTSKGLNYDNWYLVEDSPKRFIVRHKISGKERVLERG